jgi:hypothetical protein
MTIVYRPFPDLIDPESIPFGGLIVSVLDGLLVGPVQTTPAGVRCQFLVQQDCSFTAPGLDFITFAVAAEDGGTALTAAVDFSPFWIGFREVALTMRIANDVLRPVRSSSWDPEGDKPLTLTLGKVDLGIGSDGAPTFSLASGFSLPRCRLGDLPVVISATDVRWCSADNPPPTATAPADFVGLYLAQVAVELVDVGDPGTPVVMASDFLIGTGGITGRLDVMLPATWDGTKFAGPAAYDLFGFKGCLTGVRLDIDQTALTACDVHASVLIPYLDQVVGLTIGFSADGLTAVARTPTCSFIGPAATTPHASTGPSGYILTIRNQIGTLDLSRIELKVGAEGAAVTLAGRIAVTAGGFDIPPVVFQGLRIGTDGRVAVEGGWLDVDAARTASLKGFPLQITKVGFGAEADGRRWIGLNGAIKLADPLPVGASVEGLRVSWDPASSSGDIRVSLEGIGVELSSPGAFSFKGSVAFFTTALASGFRGSIKLRLDTLGFTIDASIMVGRTDDGTTFFFLYLDITLPAGIPLFSTGAAIYGFAGLLAVNLRPDRRDGEHWYYGYYRRPPIGVTRAEKWAIQRDGFAIGLGTTLGSLPDLGFAFSAKVLLVLVLPGPQLILNGQGGFLMKREDGDSASGMFDALLVLDVPGRLFQANLSARYQVPAEDPKLIDVGGGVDVAFTWAPTPPADFWHIYLGEKNPVERRIHATLIKIVQGDAWVMINRPGALKGLQQLDPERLGDFEIGGFVGIKGDWRFGPVRAWFEAAMEGAAGISFAPEQFNGYLEIRGGAGLSVFCFRVEVGVKARAEARAPTPWWLYIAVEASIKIDLFFFKFEATVRLPLRWGDPDVPLPEPVTNLATLAVEHPKADEDRSLDTATVPSDARPLITFDRPVSDGARFGSPGPIVAPPEQVGPRAFSYQLRQIVLRTAAGELVCAAGQTTVAGTTATFDGLPATGADALPNLTNATMTIIDDTFTTRGAYAVTGGSGNTATLNNPPPAGTYGYRLSAPRPTAAIDVTNIAEAPDGTALLTLAAPLGGDPQRFEGGRLRRGASAWTILAAAASTLRVQLTATALAIGAATLDGPDPTALEAAWAATGPPGDPSSATRLTVWAKTPFAFYRRNDVESVKGLDPFTTPYACGSDPIEAPICLNFAAVPDGSLTGNVTIDAVPAVAGGAVAMAGGVIMLGQPTGESGTITFRLNLPVDVIWVAAAADEFGLVTARRDGVVIHQQTLGHVIQRVRASGVDEVEITGTLARITELCYMPGWTCTSFEDGNFPQESTGVVSYAGLKLHSDGVMTVSGGVLIVGPPLPVHRPLPHQVLAGLLGADGFADESGLAGSVVEVDGLDEATVETVPAVGEVLLLPRDPSAAPGWPRPISTAPVSGGILRGLLASAESLPIPRVHGPFGLQLMAWVTFVIPRPATRVRVSLDKDATVIAFAGTNEVARATGAAGTTVALVADPHGPAHIGWCDRVTILAPAEARITRFCTDAGPFGWARFEQWRWSKGVQRTVESMYRPDPILRPGDYHLQVRTATVITGASPAERSETARASFTVGQPPGFPVGGTPAGLASATYPQGGPLTELATYTAGTVPSSGARPWYRRLDTGVVFNESYVTRMYLQTGRELRVVVRDPSGKVVRGPTAHYWGTTDIALDAWTWEWVRTLNGDGTDRCASVNLDRVTRPEALLAGAGEPLNPAQLHRCELVASSSTAAQTVHQFQFITSRFTGLVQHLATFDGRCRRRPAATGAGTVDVATLAAAWTTTANALAALVTDARTKSAAARTGTPTAATIDAAMTALTALSGKRATVRTAQAAEFGQHWAAWLGGPPAQLPDNLQITVVRLPGPAGGNVLLLESPEPLDWERITLHGIASADLPLEQATSTPTSRFGRPDAGFSVEDGDLRWDAGVELWVRDGAVRARRNDQDLNVTVHTGWAADVSLMLSLEDTATATVTTDPPRSSGALTVQAPSGGGQWTVSVPASAAEPILSVNITGRGVGVVSVSVARRYIPHLPVGDLRIADVVLPTPANPNGHHVTLVALAPVAALVGWTLQWIDPVAPGDPTLYAELPAVGLGDGQRLRLFPGLAQGPVLDDALVSAGGPGEDPPMHGAILRLVDPDGRVVHDTAVLSPAPGPAPVAIVALPDADGTRAILVPTTASPTTFTPGWWTLTFASRADAGPDLPRWSVAGRPADDTVSLRFAVRD